MCGAGGGGDFTARASFNACEKMKSLYESEVLGRIEIRDAYWALTEFSEFLFCWPLQIGAGERQVDSAIYQGVLGWVDEMDELFASNYLLPDTEKKWKRIYGDLMGLVVLMRYRLRCQAQRKLALEFEADLDNL